MTVFTKTENFQAIKENLEKKGMKIESAGLIYLPLQKIDLNQNSRLNYEKLLEALDDQDDVDEVYDNL
jgi:transcriptional/translational regulatory protein YebC/TACO1